MGDYLFKVLYLGRKTLNTIFSHVSATDGCNCFKETGALSGMDAIEVCDRYVRRKVHISSVLHLWIQRCKIRGGKGMAKGWMQLGDRGKKSNSQKYGLWEATKSSRLWLHGEWSGTIRGFMVLITAVQQRLRLWLVLTKKKTLRLLTSVRKGGLFTVLRVAWLSFMKGVMIPN